MAPITVYFDDSGTHPEANTAIAACCISTAEKWKHFDSEIESLELKEGFKAFHMAEFAARRGDFDGWGDARSRYVLGKMLAAILVRVRAVVVASVLKRDYEDLITYPFRDYCGRYHYTFVLRTVCNGIRQWARDYMPTARMHYVF
jgi:hypothetical protein